MRKMLKGITLSQFSGFALSTIGFLVMLGWIAHFKNLISLLPGYLMVFNSALCFFIVGLALLIPDSRIRWQSNIFVSVGILLSAISLLTISENLYAYSAGIDNLIVTPWLIDLNPHPGRMADNSAVAFLFAGLTFILLPFVQDKVTAVVAQISIFCVLILGFSALLGYILGMESLYTWFQYAHMSLNSAVCDTILGLGLWSLWARKTHYEQSYAGKQEQRIIVLGSTIIFCVILLSVSIYIRGLPEKALLEKSLIHEQFEPAILIAVIVGMSLLLWQLLPLVRQIIRSEKKLLETNFRLKESENRFRSAFDFAAIGMALITQQGRFLRVNRSICKILGYTERELLSMDINSVSHPDDARTNSTFVDNMLNGRIKTFQAIQRYFHKSGQIIWGSLSLSLITDNLGEPLYFIAQMQNITAEKQAEEQLRHLAYHDALTGLYNRNRLEEQMQEVLTAAQRYEDGFAFIFLDLDRFKNINDTLGHDVGDILLQIVAQRLKNTVRNTDSIARIGGDEFVIIITNLNKVDKIANIVRKILASLLQPIIIKGQEIFATTSIGISIYPYDGTDVETLMKNADLALYRAKELGRNSYQFCTPEMTAKAQQKMARQNQIMHALAKNEFELFYQPKLDLARQSISGVEALLRWHNPEYTNINAEEIIHLAEETGLIVEINDWVLRTACNQMKIWHAAGYFPLTLAVNLSFRQFKQTNFVDKLLHIIDEMEFPAEYLELELTENLIMQDPEYIADVLHALKGKHIQIAIDDFGTGYSSLDYLQKFAVDKIKIDRTFIQRITLDESSNSMIIAMIAMANKLGIKTVAEGVETREQYDFLIREKCTEIQGFYLIPPANVEIMTKFLQNPLMESYLTRSSDQNKFSSDE
ncbi:MAG: EAL domain-containing protein [Gammaproteobacteria bacterium]